MTSPVVWRERLPEARDAKSLRQAYADALLELAPARPDLLVLDADLSRSTTTDQFAATFPNQFYNMGIAEQNMVGIAAGLAAVGFTPFVTTYSIFIARCLDQIRQSVSYPRANVKIVGSHGGLAASFDGGSHQGLEDIAFMRVLPHLEILVPADHVQAQAAVRYAADHQGPVYIRLQKEPTAVFIQPEEARGAGEVVWGRAGGLTIVTCGSVAWRCLAAARRLEAQATPCRVALCARVKPLDEALIRRLAAESRAILVVEEHMRIGGLFEAVCAALRGAASRPLDAVAMPDRYGETGPWDVLLDHFGFAPEAIAAAGIRLLAAAEPLAW